MTCVCDATDTQLRTVEAEGASEGWSYTIGLHETFGLPDVLMTDGPYGFHPTAVRAMAETAIEMPGHHDCFLGQTGLRVVHHHQGEIDPELIMDRIGRYDRLPERHELIELKLPTDPAKRADIVRRWTKPS